MGLLGVPEMQAGKGSLSPGRGQGGVPLSISSGPGTVGRARRVCPLQLCETVLSVPDGIPGVGVSQDGRGGRASCEECRGLAVSLPREALPHYKAHPRGSRPLAPGTHGPVTVPAPGWADHLLRGSVPACCLPSALEGQWSLLSSLPKGCSRKPALNSLTPPGGPRWSSHLWPVQECGPDTTASGRHDRIHSHGADSAVVQGLTPQCSWSRDHGADSCPNFMLHSQVLI